MRVFSSSKKPTPKPMSLTTRTSPFITTLLFVCLALSARAASITNNFDSGLNYQGSIAGTIWDGVYLGNGDVPRGNNGGSIGGTVHADETSFSGFLAVQSTNTGWAGTEDDGFLL